MEETAPRLEGEKPDDTRQRPNGSVSRAGRDCELLPCLSSFTGVGRERDEMRDPWRRPVGATASRSVVVVPVSGTSWWAYDSRVLFFLMVLAGGSLMVIALDSCVYV